MNATDSTIRPYAPADLIPVVGLWYGAWQESNPGKGHVLPIEQWRERWQRWVVPSASIHVACVDGCVGGYVAAVRAAPWLSHAIVNPGYRRRGIGTRLLEAAKASSSAGLMFDVIETDGEARKFYAGCGFAAGEAVVHPRTGEPMIRYVWLAHA